MIPAPCTSSPGGGRSARTGGILARLQVESAHRPHGRGSGSWATTTICSAPLSATETTSQPPNQPLHTPNPIPTKPKAGTGQGPGGGRSRGPGVWRSGAGGAPSPCPAPLEPAHRSLPVSLTASPSSSPGLSQGRGLGGAVGYVLVPTPRTCECVGPYLGIGSLLMQEGLRGSRPGKAPHPADRGGPVTEMESRPFHSHSLQGGDPLTEPGKPEGLSREGEQALR